MQSFFRPRSHSTSAIHHCGLPAGRWSFPVGRHGSPAYGDSPNYEQGRRWRHRPEADRCWLGFRTICSLRQPSPAFEAAFLMSSALRRLPSKVRLRPLGVLRRRLPQTTSQTRSQLAPELLSEARACERLRVCHPPSATSHVAAPPQTEQSEARSRKWRSSEGTNLIGGRA